MDLSFSPEEEAFREEVRAFIAAEVPQRLRDRLLAGVPPGKADFQLWQEALYRKGWMAPNWPKAYGGAEWSPAQQYIFEEEAFAAGCPRVIPFGVVMLGPVLLRFGSEEQ
ncbi:MAG: acyl-CoA dehydrogenase family protein, partial [Pseudomonadota bacterium]|nr:acyl-CoA dehydrogenase family protein [Pseudomonadota bacterium]